MESIRRTKIVDLLRKEKEFGATVAVKGWVRTIRGNKYVNFIHLNDGSTIHNLQIVADVEKFGETFFKPVSTGACIHRPARHGGPLG